MIGGWKIFYITKNAWEVMLEDINNAQKSILLEQFLFKNFNKGEIGKIFLETLIKKAKEGVKVKLLIDTVGSTYFLFSDDTNNLIDCGIELRYHALSKKNPATNIFLNFFRDHRKVLVIDEKIGYIGGVVIGENMKNWRDTQVRIENDLVPLLKGSFDSIWNSIEKTSGGPREYRNRHLNKNNEGFLGNCPRKKDKALRKEILNKINQSRKKIWITTPYFGPSRKMIRALTKASRRNVDVRIILPEKSDNIKANFLTKSYFRGLMKKNIHIHRYNEMIHAKTIVIDDWVSVGSFNFDFLSEYFNHELNLVTHNKDVLENIVSQFDIDFQKTTKYTFNQYKQEPYYMRTAWYLFNLLKIFT